MADPITREQVERAIEMAHVGNVYLSDFLGPGINWSLHAPDYVCRLWISPPLSPMRVRGTTAAIADTLLRMGGLLREVVL